ncbi:MAG: hypothetical protein JSW64_06230 [Candidatus Zixiibacteriota bacterium]|nr:MAG: hypothetical protein JSW64_06230 [candidate division Zixibacteria bacterium]
MAPGESTVVELIFKTRSYKTRISKYATIYSNDPVQSTDKIHLSANVYASTDTALPFTLPPGNVSLSKDSKKGKIVLENKGDSRLWIEPAGGLLEGLSLKVKNDDPKPGQKSELRFEWKDDFEKENVERSVTFLVYGEGADSTRFSVPIVLQGTDPAPPPKVTRPKRTTTGKSIDAKKRTVRRPARRTTSATEDPRVVKPAKTEKAETTKPVDAEKPVPSPTAKEKLSLEKKTEESKSKNSPQPAGIESEENQ